MNRTLNIFMAAVFIFAMAGCASNNSNSPSSPGTSPTATPNPSSGTVFVLANFQLTGTNGLANCTLENSTTSAWINDATVSVNTQSLPFVLDGVYQNLTLAGTFATGDTVTITIVTSFGTATASGTIPASGVNSVSVTNADVGSVFNISH